jgi:predicted 3-demethylubiquinone-9 3-methyltransferase (glyoxalase superfamily)
MQKITPCLWFDGEAEEAARFYVQLFKNSNILDVTHYGESGPGSEGQVLTVEFELDGQCFTALNGGAQFTFNEAVSLQVDCEDQAEVDRLWDALTADGGAESQCGWLKDKYGLSWQIIPSALPRLIGGPDPQKAQRAMEAMLQMKKIDIDELQRAYDAG